MSVASEAMVTVATEGGMAEVEEGVATTEEEGEEGNIIYCSQGYIYRDSLFNFRGLGQGLWLISPSMVYIRTGLCLRMDFSIIQLCCRKILILTPMYNYVF